MVRQDKFKVGDKVRLVPESAGHYRDTALGFNRQENHWLTADGGIMHHETLINSAIHYSSSFSNIEDCRLARDVINSYLEEAGYALRKTRAVCIPKTFTSE